MQLYDPNKRDQNFRHYNLISNPKEDMIDLLFTGTGTLRENIFA
jgi:hypothetical protein